MLLRDSKLLCRSSLFVRTADILETWRSFQRKFNVPKLTEKGYNKNSVWKISSGKVNEDRAGNVGNP